MDMTTGEPPIVCPFCRRIDGQSKAGRNNALQRFKCSFCNRRYTPAPRRRGYSDELREKAAELKQDGLTQREIARRLNVSHQTIVNWLRSKDSSTPKPSPTPRPQRAVVPPEIRVPDERRPTIRDVARAAGVSNATVSNYLNEKGYLSEETRQRVVAAVEALHFTPNALVRAIRHRRTRILGVLLFGVDNLDANVGVSLAPPLLSGINAAAHAAEFNVLLYPGWVYSPHRHPGLPFLDGHIDGLLWVAPEMHEPILERVAAAHLPVVALLTRHVPDGVGYVNADNGGAMRDVIQHLVEMGHRRIAYVGPASNSNFIDRWTGFQQALAAADLPLDSALQPPHMLDLPLHQWWDDDVYGPILEGFLALPERPTAIVLPDDGLAARMIEQIEAHGLSVPKDIAVVGFNDIPDARFIGGGLTTVRQPFRRIGEVAVERLLALIDGAPLDECRVTLPTELVARATTVAG